MFLSEYVDRDPAAELRYFETKVLLPGVRPVRRDVALARIASLPDARSEFASEGVPPFTDTDMKAVLLPCALSWLVRITSALPDAGMVTVTDGPGEPAKSP